MQVSNAEDASGEHGHPMMILEFVIKVVRLRYSGRRRHCTGKD